MRLLILAGYFHPERMASSHLDDNRFSAFANAGIEMLVYAPTPTRGLPENYIKAPRKEALYDGKLIVNRFSLYGEGKNPILRAIRYLIQGIKHFNRGAFCKEAKKSDAVYVVSTPPIQGAIAALVKKVRHIPFIYNLQDIFPDSMAGTGLAKKGGLLWKIGRVVENFTYKNADKIIVISEDFKKNIMAKGVPEDKIVVVYNWVDEQAVVDVPREENKLFDKYGLDRSKFYITYNGNIGLTQNMDMLLEVAHSLKSNKDIRFVLVGNGAYLEKVQQIIKDRSINNVMLLPFQPYEDISHVFSLGDVSLVISKPGVGENSVPSKTWSIMSASRPVLANFDENELKSIITDNNCGIFTKAGDRNSFKDAILKLYKDRKLCRTMGKNGRQFVMANLTKDYGTRKYVEVIKSFENK